MLQLEYDLEPDEHGVFDGREIARHLIGTAYRLVATYTGGCPSCTDKLISAIANQVIEGIWQDLKPDGSLRSAVITAGDAPEDAYRAHLAAAEASTRAMLSLP